MVTALNDQEKSSIVRFKQQAQEFWSIWQEYNSPKVRAYVANQSPQLQADYRQFMNKGARIRGIVETTTGAIDKAVAAYSSVKDWFRNRFGMGEYHYQSSTMNGLGIAPLALIGGAAAITTVSLTIASWVKESKRMKYILKEVKRLEDKGIEPNAAYQMAIRAVNASKTSIFSGVGSYILPLIVVGGAIVLLPKLSKRK